MVLLITPIPVLPLSTYTRTCKMDALQSRSQSPSPPLGLNADTKQRKRRPRHAQATASFGELTPL